jgi:hypothetical protein
MRSLADARARERRQRVERSLVEVGSDSVAAPDAQLHARQCLKAIAAFFAADAEILMLIAELTHHRHAGSATPPALSAKRRDAARKRLARAILRGDLDRFLP